MTEDYSASPARHSAPTLQRGKACLRCRSVFPALPQEPPILFPLQEEKNGNSLVPSWLPPSSLPPQRCDGAKPSCQQCVRAKKQDLCEYDDGKGKTRTQLLRETVARLEARIKELESPEHTSSSVPLFDPHAIPGSEDSSSSGADSPLSVPFSASQSPIPLSECFVGVSVHIINTSQPPLPRWPAVLQSHGCLV
jgi:hypothetical protein